MQLSSWLVPSCSLNTPWYLYVVMLIEPNELSPLSSPWGNRREKLLLLLWSHLHTKNTFHRWKERSFWGDNVIFSSKKNSFLSFLLPPGLWRNLISLFVAPDEQEGFQFLIAVSAKIIDSGGENNLHAVKNDSLWLSDLLCHCASHQ